MIYETFTKNKSGPVAADAHYVENEDNDYVITHEYVKKSEFKDYIFKHH